MDTEAFMEDLRLMVTGLRKFMDEDEREKGVQLLVRVTSKRDLFTKEHCAQGKRWELELQGTRLRQAAWQDHGLEPESPEEEVNVRSISNKGRRGDRKSSSGRRGSKKEGNELCGRVNNIVAAVRQERMAYLQVIVVGDSDGYKDRRFYWHLVEDRASFTGGAMNYAEYMQHVNRQSVGGMAM